MDSLSSRCKCNTRRRGNDSVRERGNDRGVGRAAAPDFDTSRVMEKDTGPVILSEAKNPCILESVNTEILRRLRLLRMTGGHFFIILLNRKHQLLAGEED